MSLINFVLSVIIVVGLVVFLNLKSDYERRLTFYKEKLAETIHTLDSSWVHVAASCKNNNVSFYVNGSEMLDIQAVTKGAWLRGSVKAFSMQDSFASKELLSDEVIKKFHEVKVR